MKVTGSELIKDDSENFRELPVNDDVRSSKSTPVSNFLLLIILDLKISCMTIFL